MKATLFVLLAACAALSGCNRAETPANTDAATTTSTPAPAMPDTTTTAPDATVPPGTPPPIDGTTPETGTAPR